MATSKTNVTTSWVQVATSAQEFLVENQSSFDVKIAFADSTPAADAAAHILEAGEALTRLSLVGAVYVRNSVETESPYVIVSTS